MCFSATASFTAAGAVSVAGLAALRRTNHTWQVLLGAVPLLFAIHQSAEGVLWIALSGPKHSDWSGPAALVYLIVAKVVWPVWIPAAVLASETRPWRRKSLSLLLAVGAVVSVALACGLYAFPPTPSISGSHLLYRQETPALFRWTTGPAYVLVLTLPPLLSSMSLMRWVGLLVAISLIVSMIFYSSHLASVWCFFAALISVLLVVVVRCGERRAEPAGTQAP
jgi:Family of unknown function (DUF6629)